MWKFNIEHTKRTTVSSPEVDKVLQGGKNVCKS